MSVAPNLCCDKTKNRGTYTHVTKQKAGLTLSRALWDSWTRKPFCASFLIGRGFPGGSAGKESACSSGDLGSIPGLGRSPGGGKGYPLQYLA